jgi:hypothetical protein
MHRPASRQAPKLTWFDDNELQEKSASDDQLRKFTWDQIKTKRSRIFAATGRHSELTARNCRRHGVSLFGSTINTGPEFGVEFQQSSRVRCRRVLKEFDGPSRADLQLPREHKTKGKMTIPFELLAGRNLWHVGHAAPKSNRLRST